MSGKKYGPRPLSKASTAEAQDLSSCLDDEIMAALRMNLDAVDDSVLMPPPPPPTSNNKKAQLEDARVTEETIARHNEMTKIIMQQNAEHIGIDADVVRACEHTNSVCAGTGHEDCDDDECVTAAATAQPTLSLEEQSRLYAGKELAQLSQELALQIRERNPKMKRTEAMALLQEQLTIELHRLRHVYELRRTEAAEPINKRFKKWLGVVPGSVQAEVEAAIRKRMPNERPSRVQARAKDEMMKMRRKEKVAYQAGIQDDKMTRLLVYSFLVDGDEEALQIFADFRRAQIDFECGASRADDAERRYTQLEAHIANLRNLKVSRAHTQSLLEEAINAPNRREEDFVGTTANVMPIAAGYEPPSAIVRSELVTLLPGTAPDDDIGTIRRLYTRSGQPIEPGLVTQMTYFSAYADDQSKPPEKQMQSHCAGLIESLQSTISLTATFLAIAPSDTIYVAHGEADCGDPVDNMYQALRNSDPTFRLQRDTFHSCIALWSKVQSESPADTDRELVSLYNQNEVGKLVATAPVLGISEEQMQKEISLSAHPRTSAIIDLVTHYVNSKVYRDAAKSAAEHTKMQERIDERSRKKARDDRLAGVVPPLSTNGLSGAMAQAAAEQHARNQLMLDAAMLLPEMEPATVADFLRPPQKEWGERPCLNGQSCAARIMRATYPSYGTGSKQNKGFVAREFITKAQQAEYDAGKKLPAYRQLCWLCSTAQTTDQYHKFDGALQGTPARRSHELLQNHRVKVNVEGAFDLDACLPIKGPIVAPVLHFDESDYMFSTTVVNGQEMPCIVMSPKLLFRLPRRGETSI